MNKNKLNELKECFNKEIDSKIEQCLIKEKKENVKTLPLYHMCNIFESLAADLWDKTQSKQLFRKYTTTIKENKDIFAEYWFNHTLNEAKNISNSKVFVDEALKFARPVDSVYKEGLNSIAKIVCEAFDILGFSSKEIDNVVNNTKSELCEAIHYVYNSKNRMDKQNLLEQMNKCALVQENVSPADAKDVNEEKEYTTEDAKKHIEETLSGKQNLLDWETSAVKDKVLSVLAGEDASKVFEGYRNDCLSLIEEMIKDTSVESYGQLQLMKEELESKKYNPLTENEDLLKLSELKNVLLKG